MSEILATVFFGIGVLFNFFGCIGLLRFPDVYNRLQAGTKCVTFGTIFLLIGVLVYTGFTSMGVKAVLCLIFLLITSPTVAHAISRGAHHSLVKLWKNSVVDKYKEEGEGGSE